MFLSPFRFRRVFPSFRRMPLRFLPGTARSVAPARCLCRRIATPCRLSASWRFWRSVRGTHAARTRASRNGGYIHSFEEGRVIVRRLLRLRRLPSAVFPPGTFPSVTFPATLFSIGTAVSLFSVSCSGSSASCPVSSVSGASPLPCGFSVSPAIIRISSSSSMGLSACCFFIA